MIVLAAVAAVVSLVVAWRNARYVVHRVQRLAGHSVGRFKGGSSASAATTRRDALRDLGIQPPDEHEGIASRNADELDHIEATVAGLAVPSSVRARKRLARSARRSITRARSKDLLQAVTARFATRAQDAQLPLHILLSSPFGSLNENQEEMLGAAISAVDAIDTEVRELRKLVQLNRGELSIVTQPMNLAELLRPTLAIAAARAESAHVQLRPVVSDTSPRAIVDAVLAQEALTSILLDAIANTAARRRCRCPRRRGRPRAHSRQHHSRPMLSGTAGQVARNASRATTPGGAGMFDHERWSGDDRRHARRKRVTRQPLAYAGTTSQVRSGGSDVTTDLRLHQQHLARHAHILIERLVQLLIVVEAVAQPRGVPRWNGTAVTTTLGLNRKAVRM